MDRLIVCFRANIAAYLFTELSQKAARKLLPVPGGVLSVFECPGDKPQDDSLFQTDVRKVIYTLFEVLQSRLILITYFVDQNEAVIVFI
jgi:hypothetical protein